MTDENERMCRTRGGGCARWTVGAHRHRRAHGGDGARAECPGELDGSGERAEPQGAAERPSDGEAFVRRLASVGNAFAPSFSPDGSKVALVSDMSGVC